MEAVSLESLPPEDSDLYIPNLSGVQMQNATSPSSDAALQSLQLSTIRYTPSTPAAAQGAIPPPLVAAQTPGSLIQGIYRTTFTTQVIAAQTFHYPPTPPIEGHATERGEKHHLQANVETQVLPPITQGIMENELNETTGMEKTMNPFPSPLPTPPDINPPDIESLSISDQQHNRDSIQTSMVKTVTSGHQQWAAQPMGNTSFMPQATASSGSQLVPYNGASCGVGARRGYPPCPVPALQQMCYSASGVPNQLSFNDPRYAGTSGTAFGEMLKKIPAVPALVKDGECS